MIRPKQHLHSFAFTTDTPAGDILFVGRDGVINIAPVTNAPAVSSGGPSHKQRVNDLIHQIAVNAQGELAIAVSTNNARILTPDVTSGTTQSGRAQMLFSAGEQTAGLQRQLVDSLSPRALAAGSSKQRLPHEIPEAEDSDSDADDVATGSSSWRSVGGADIAVVTRKRAEDDYGLGDVSTHAIFMTDAISLLAMPI